MIELIRNNVVKVVDSEEKADKLKAEGFELLSSPSEAEPDKDKQEELLYCPYCNKPYKTKKGLEDHIAKEHPEAGGDGNGAGSAKDNAGSNL